MRPHRIKMIMLFKLCLALVSLTILSFIGCGGGGGGSSDPPPSGPANIEVNKTSLSFGDTVLDQPSNQTISIQNTGLSNLTIGQIAQSNPLAAPFSIFADNCSGTQVAPSRKCTLQVRFSPTLQGAFQDAFDIPSNDPVKASMTVSVSGYGRGLNVVINKVYTDSCPKVSLLITMTDKNANPLAGLTKDSFSLFENGVAKAIESVAQVKSAVSASLVLDYSSSMVNNNLLPDLEAAAKGFIDQLNPGNHDEAEIVKYAANIYRMQDFTTDQAALKAAIDTPYPGNNLGTRMYDAVWLATDDLAARTNLRAIVVFSDGKDDMSTRSLPEVMAHCKEKGVNVFTIGLGNADAENMQQLANQTGGQYFYAPNSSQLIEIYLKIAAIITGQYLIEYNSSSSGAGIVNLALEAVLNDLQGMASIQFSGCP